jgi:hypothetical protein
MKIEAHRILRQFDKYRNRRKAPEKPDKWNFKIKESEQEKQRSTLNGGTHTTLRCCGALLTGNPQKTELLGSRPNCRGRLKALAWVQNACRACLLLSYINNLNPRPPLPLSNTQGA